MTIGRDLLTKAETVTVAAIEAGVPTLIEAREIIAEFHLMIRRKTEAGLIPWIERALFRAGSPAGFTTGVPSTLPGVEGLKICGGQNGAPLPPCQDRVEGGCTPPPGGLPPSRLVSLPGGAVPGDLLNLHLAFLLIL
jgi:hypothetical protein